MQPENNKQNNTSRQERIEAFLLDPDKTIFESMEQFESAVSALVEILSSVDIAALEQLQGVDGVTPVRGKDYFNEEDIASIEAFILSKIPKIGQDLPSTEQVKAFIAAEVAKIPRIKGDKGDAGTKGKDGRDGSPDTWSDILKKYRAAPKNNRFKISDIRGLENVLRGLVNTADEFEELKKAFEDRMVVFNGPGTGNGGESNDATAIHTDIADEFSTITEDSTPEADSWFIYEAATGGAKFKIKFSDIGNGTDGRTILNGAVDPTTEGANGDFYINTNTWQIFGPKASGTWPAGVDLIGADGTDGDDGADGTDGDFINKYQGPWSAGTYTLGEIVTNDGSSWIVTAASTTEEPTGTPTDWDMIAEKGADGAGVGDMEASTYDPTNKAGDAFDMDNMDEGTDTKIMTAAERTKIGHISVTQAVDLDAIETRVNELDAAIVLKGTWDASAGTFPGGGTAQAGDSYIVSVGGTVDSVVFNVGDRIIAILDNASTTTFAANWFKADYTDQVLSVASKTGAVTLDANDVAEVSNKRYMTDAQETKLDSVESSADVTDAVNVGSSIHGATAKTTPVDADTFPMIDSAASNVLKKVTWANIKATLKTYFDSLTTTLTNKRITKRIGTTASSSTPTPSADDHDQYNVTALAAGATFGAPTGTPTDGQTLIIRVKDNGTARTLAYNAIYRALGVTLPTTTVISKTIYLGMIYNAADTKWDVTAVAEQA